MEPNTIAAEPKGKAYIIILIITILFVGFNLFLSYKRTEEIAPFQKFCFFTLEFVLNSFRQPPIKNIAFLEGNSSCLNNESHVLYEWSSFEVCPCPGPDKNYFEGPCPPMSDPKRAKCAEPFYIHQNLTRWRNRTVCIENSENWYTSFKPCKTGYRHCSKQVCVSENESCPITNIVKMSKPLSLGVNMTDLGPADEEHHLVGVKDPNQNTTIISLRESMVTHPCVNPYLRPNRSKVNIFPSHFPGEIGCVYRDDVIYSKIDEYNEYLNLIENNISSQNDVYGPKVIEAVKNITEQGLAKLYLQKRLLFREDSNCPLYQTKQFVEDLDEIFDYENNKKDYINRLVFFLELWMVTLIILFIVQFQPFKNYFVECCIRKEWAFPVQFYGTITLNSFLILYIFFIVVTINSEGDDVDEILKEVSIIYEENPHGCFQNGLYDELMLKVMSYFTDRSEEGYSYGRKVIGLMIIFIILMILSNFISTWFSEGLTNYRKRSVVDEKQKAVTELTPLREQEDD